MPAHGRYKTWGAENKEMGRETWARLRVASLEIERGDLAYKYTLSPQWGWKKIDKTNAAFQAELQELTGKLIS
jgi:hypothetical protein